MDRLLVMSWGFPLVRHELAHLIKSYLDRLGTNYQLKKPMLIFYFNHQRNAADQRGINTPKRVSSADIVSSGSAADRRITVGDLTYSHGLSIGTVD